MIKNKKNTAVLKVFFIFIIAGALTLAGVINDYIAVTKEVVLNDGEVVECFKTQAVTVDDVLNERNIEVTNYDIITPALTAEIGKIQSIDIKRSKGVFILLDGEKKEVFTCKDTVGQLLEAEDIELGKDDIINYDLSDEITEDMNIEITRVKIIEEIVEESIPYDTQEIPNSEMESGSNNLVTRGAEGIKLKKYLVEYHDGEEADRTFVEEEVKVEPIDEVIEYGTLKNLETSRGEVLRYTKVLNMRATAYDLSVESCGKEPDDPLYGITYTGMKARHGVVAVDPNTIPLYSRLYIEAADGSWIYGKAVAGDIGGAVKGNIIDLFYEDPEFVDNFGVKTVKVYILK